jgi:hypothetical protein
MKLKYRGLRSRYDAVGKPAVDAISKAVRVDIYTRAFARAVLVLVAVWLAITERDDLLVGVLRLIRLLL